MALSDWSSASRSCSARWLSHSAARELADRLVSSRLSTYSRAISLATRADFAGSGEV